MNRLENKTALITGATSGVGKSCAISLAQNGVHLILCGRRKQKLIDLKEEIKSISDKKIEILELDVSHKENVKNEIFSILKHNSIDILINSAGLSLNKETIDQGIIDDWDIMIDTNLKGLLYVSRMVIPHMKERNKGHIINLGSIAGVGVYPGGNVYCATKAAVHSLSDAMNADLLGTSIRVCNIAPGSIKTEFMNVRFRGDENKSREIYEDFSVLSPDDIAELALFILNAPEHVNIQSCLVTPTEQRNLYLFKSLKNGNQFTFNKNNEI